MFTEPLVRKYTGEGHSCCFYCGKPDGKKAIEATSSGQQYFCFSEKHQVKESCYRKFSKGG